LYRDPDAWYASFQHLFANYKDSYWVQLFVWPVKSSRPFYPLRRNRQIWWRDVYNYSDKGKEFMPFYLDKVRTAVAAERILEFKVQDGWAPLCKFLNKDIPTEEFPRRNDFQELSERRKKLQRQAWAIWLKWFKQAAMIVIIAAICWRALFFFE
jgi:hypothetical protein